MIKNCDYKLSFGDDIWTKFYRMWGGQAIPGSSAFCATGAGLAYSRVKHQGGWSEMSCGHRWQDQEAFFIFELSLWNEKQGKHKVL